METLIKILGKNYVIIPKILTELNEISPEMEREEYLIKTKEINEKHKKEITEILEITAENLLGALLINNLNGETKIFILSIIELYADVLGDIYGDYSRRFKANSNTRKNSLVKLEEGITLYRNSKSDNSNYYRSRCDLTLGVKNIPVSFLLRGLLREDFSTIGNPDKGSPNIIIREDHLNLKWVTHGKKCILLSFEEEITIPLKRSLYLILPPQNLLSDRDTRQGIIGKERWFFKLKTEEISCELKKMYLKKIGEVKEKFQ